MADITYNASRDGGTQRTIDRGTLPIWIPYGGIENPTSLQYIHSLCNVQGIDSPSLEFINETTINALGKLPTTVNDGMRIGEFSVTIRGNDVATLYALVGLNWNDVFAPDLYKDHGMKGALMLYKFKNGKGEQGLERTDLILDVSVKIQEMPGGQVGSDTEQTVTFYADEARMFTIPEGHSPAFEVFYDNGGTITNANAPDGALTDFDLGDGNGSYAPGSPINPATVDIEAYAALTGYKQKFFYVRVDGVDQDPAQVAYSITATNHLEFTTAPADGAKLEVCYLVALSSYKPPNTRADLLPTGGMAADWRTVLV